MNANADLLRDLSPFGPWDYDDPRRCSVVCTDGAPAFVGEGDLGLISAMVNTRWEQLEHTEANA